MVEYALAIAGSIKARNFASAQKKVQALEKKLSAAGVDACHIQIKGEQ